MGHTRLGIIPKTQKWRDIVNGLSSSGEIGVQPPEFYNINSLISQTLEATQNYLGEAKNDLGLRYTFYLLAKVALASRDEGWVSSLQKLGINIREGDSLVEFTTEFQTAIDDYLSRNLHSSDISEIAQQAAGEALTNLVAPKAITLFGAGTEELQSAVKDYSTKNGFSRLGQKFFGIFVARYINFYISRVTAAQLGNPRLSHVGELSRFNDELQLHCEQSAKIVHDFCGEWYSKTQYIEGINLNNSSRFLAIALKKLQAEFELQEADL